MLVVLLLSLFPCLFQLAVPLIVDRLAPAFQRRQRRNVTDGTVQPLLVVYLDVLSNQPLGIFVRHRHSWPDSLALNRFMPALDFPVRLRIVWRGAPVRHARYPDKLLEVLGDKLRTVVRNNSRPGVGTFLLGMLQ